MSDVPKIPTSAPAGPGPAEGGKTTEPSITVTRRVAVLGGGREDMPREILREAARLGELLAKERYTVVCGGYGGVMRAVCGAAHEAGGEVFAVTAEYNPDQQANPSWTYQVRHRDLVSRMRYFLESVDAFVVLPGGVGTLAELAMAWNLLKTQEWGHDAPPLLVWQEPWREMIDGLSTSPGFWRPDLQLLIWVRKADDALEFLDQQVKVGHALQDFEEEHVDRAARIDRYLRSTHLDVRSTFADLEPVLWRPDGLPAPREKLLEIGARLLGEEPADLAALDEVEFREVLHARSEVWSSEFQAPNHGKLRVLGFERRLLLPEREAGVQELETVHGTATPARLEDGGEGERVLRFFDRDRGWVVTFPLGDGEVAAVSGRDPRSTRRMIEGIEISLAAR